MMTHPRPRPLSLGVLAVFVCVVLLVLAGGAWLIHAEQLSSRQQVEANLRSIAVLKSHQIAGWRAERLTDAEMLAERRDLGRYVAQYLAAPSGELAAEIVSTIQPVMERYRFADILLLDPDGVVRLRLNPATDFDPVGYRATFQEVLLSRRPQWTPIHAGPGHPAPHLAIVAPMLTGDGDGELSGCLVLVSDADRFLYPLIQSWPTPSETAETLLVRRDGDDVLFLNELRHRQGTALQLRIPVSRTDLPAAMAIAGREGVVQGLDYRGVEVVAAILPMPDSAWFMVAKVDVSEAFAAARVQSRLILGIMLAAIACVGVMALTVYQRHQKQQYRELYDAEAALRAALEQHRVTLQAIGDAVISTDIEGRVELMNPVAEELTGWTFEEARARDLAEVFQIFAEDTGAPVENPVARVIREHRVVGLANHTVLRSRDGREIPIADSGAPIHDEDGKVNGVVLVFRDQAEERWTAHLTKVRLSLIQDAEELTLEGLLTRSVDEVGALVGSPIGSYSLIDADQQTVSTQRWSSRSHQELSPDECDDPPAPVDITGIVADCLRQRQPLVRNDPVSQVAAANASDRTPEIVRGLAVPVVRDDRVVAVLEVANKPTDYTDRDATTVSYLADITWEIVRQKAAAQELRDSESRYRLLAENTLDVIWSMSMALEFTYVNPAIEALTGHTPEEWIGSNLRDHSDEAAFNRMGHVIAQELARGVDHAGVVLESTMLRKDGSEVPVEIHGLIIYDELGNPFALQGTTRDISERRRAEREHEALQEQLLQAQKMESIGRLAGGVAHDFNNMLAVILGRVDLMRMKSSDDDPRAADLEEIEKAARRSAELTRQLLAFARRQNIAPKVLDLNQAVEGTLSMLRRMIGENIDLAWRPASDLWPVLIDPAQLNQILTNLCINARDAIGGVGKLTIETHNVVIDDHYGATHVEVTPGGYAMLAVSDDGCGMDAATQSLAFEPFFTSKGTGQGTGLGLSTVYGIVKQNAGFINLYSEPGQGATFRIYLPRHEGATTRIPTADTQIPQGRGETVLLVEDEPGILEVVAQLLVELGYRPLAVGSAPEAVELVESGQVQVELLITDVVMPKMSGKELAGRLTELLPDLRVLYMSGYTANVIAHHGVLNEGVHFLQKPFSRHELATRIRAALA